MLRFRLKKLFKKKLPNPQNKVMSLGDIDIWHKSARMGEILNTCHNFEIFRALVIPEWSLCRGHLLVPGYKCWRECKTVVHTS